MSRAELDTLIQKLNKDCGNPQQVYSRAKQIFLIRLENAPAGSDVELALLENLDELDALFNIR